MGVEAKFLVLTPKLCKMSMFKIHEVYSSVHRPYTRSVKYIFQLKPTPQLGIVTNIVAAGGDKFSANLKAKRRICNKYWVCMMRVCCVCMMGLGWMYEKVQWHWRNV